MIRALICIFVLMAVLLGTLGIAIIVMSLPTITRYETATTIAVHMHPLDWIGLLRGLTALGGGILILWVSGMLYAEDRDSANIITTVSDR